MMAALERDPVCGMELRPGQEEATVVYAGRAYRFCSVECRRTFEQNPKQYASMAEAESR